MLGAEGSGQDPGWADYGLGQATVMDGVRLIAGGIEVVLQRLQLQVRRDTEKRPCQNNQLWQVQFAVACVIRSKILC